MVSKYAPLTAYLKRNSGREIPMTFREIESIIGVSLPPSKAHRAWWSNNPSNNVMTSAWLAAGYETQQVDVERQRLKFVHRSKRSQEGDGAVLPPEGGRPTGRHPAWGSMKGTTIVMPGVDLTAPTAPEWGRLDEE